MIYFASDIHLGAGDPQTARAVERRFVAWLDRVARDAEAVFLLGDVFDFWFEYRGVVPKGFVRTLGKLAELTDRGVRVVFFTGNHDMWVGDYLTRECGVEVRTAPEVMTLAGQRVFVAHGDNLNVRGDWKLVLLNRMFRSRLLRWCFAWGLHPDLAMRFGRWWSGTSRKSHNAAAQRRGGAADFCARLTEPLIAYARAYARTHAIDHFVFGHMHFARDCREGALHTVHLGCWEQTPTYAVLDRDGALRLETFDGSHLFSPRQSPCEPDSALGLAKTFRS